MLPWPTAPLALSLSSLFRLPLTVTLGPTDTFMLMLLSSPSPSLGSALRPFPCPFPLTLRRFEDELMDSGGSDAVESAAEMDCAGGRTVTFFDRGFLGGGLRAHNGQSARDSG